MPSNSVHVCVPCRLTFKQTGKCPTCGGPMTDRGSRWRAPKRTNDRAWRRIEQGDWLWDHPAVERFERRRLARWEARMARIKKIRRGGRIWPNRRMGVQWDE